MTLRLQKNITPEGDSDFKGVRNLIDRVPDPLLPLCIDLDGTLVRTDTFVELLINLLKKNFLYIFALPIWLKKGKAHFKHQIAARSDIAVDVLPYNEELMAELKVQKAKGKNIILATASPRRIAEKVAAHVGIFSRVIASDEHINCQGERKAAALVEAFGEKGFSYAGNAATDLAVWKSAHDGMIVSSSNSLISRAKQATTITHVFSASTNASDKWLAALRTYQWVKNILIFLPLIAAHRVADFSLVIEAFIAFLSFSLLASAVYLTNDLLDLDADRRHARKRLRPFAAGTLPLVEGIVAAPFLVVVSLLFASLLAPSFTVLLLLYLLGTTLYSFYFKRLVLIDVIVLALLYTVRIFAGAAAIAVPVSSWLTAFALFFFLSLAVVKRFTELQRVATTTSVQAHGRGYHTDDREIIAHIGITSGYLSAVVLALYISSEEINNLYQTPEILWLLVPVLLYWISRVWILAHRGQMTDDPITFAAQDRTSYLTALAGLAIIIAAAIGL